MKVKDFKKLLKNMHPDDDILCRAYDFDGECQSVEFDTELNYYEQFGDCGCVLVIIAHEFEHPDLNDKSYLDFKL
jgi:hypothetical protein